MSQTYAPRTAPGGPQDRRLELLEGSWRAFRQTELPLPIELGRLERTAGYPEWLATVAWQGLVPASGPGPGIRLLPH